MNLKIRNSKELFGTKMLIKTRIQTNLSFIFAVCFRKALSGKRVTHYVAKTLSCETLDDCRQECAMQSSFVCEGFNYR